MIVILYLTENLLKMKKIFLSLFTAAILFGCNSQDSATTTEDHSDHEHATATHDAPDQDHATTAGVTTLETGVPSLNDGAKWKADASTNENVANLKSIIDRFKTNADPAVEDYHAFQASFTDGISKMVKECKMQGPDHDALHVWLEPLMKDNKELKEQNSKEALAATFSTINERVNIYPQYFE